MRTRRRRRGFTLIELLVVISIIGILVGLLLPAINSAREAGRRTQCQSNMRNVGLAILGYVNSKNAFPPSGTFCEDGTNTLPGDPTTSVVNNFIYGGASNSSVGVPMYSWVLPILPYMDAQDMFNQWTMFNTSSQTSGKTTTTTTAAVSYYDQTNYIAGQASNYTIGNTAIGVLRCPDDITAQPNQGNLSYVVNGGFALWHPFAYGWTGSQIDGSESSTLLTWAPSASGWSATMGVTQKLGVFFTSSVYPQGNPTRIQWNVNSTLTSLADGASSTLMISENTLAGVGATQYTMGLQSNWAAPMPTTATFIGSSAVCGGKSMQFPTSTDCTAGQLASASVNSGAGTQSGDNDGLGWQFANKVGTFENINFAQNAGLTIEGSFPFSNSGHPGGCNMMFCDGAVRFITSTIDGTVYSKLITPAGSRLPFYCKQMPLSQDSFVP